MARCYKELIVKLEILFEEKALMQKAVIYGVFSFANYLAPTSISSLIMVLLTPKRFFQQISFHNFLWHQWSKMLFFVNRCHFNLCNFTANW